MVPVSPAPPPIHSGGRARSRLCRASFVPLMFPYGGCESDDSKGEGLSWDLMLSSDPRENLSHRCVSPQPVPEKSQRSVGMRHVCESFHPLPLVDHPDLKYCHRCRKTQCWGLGPGALDIPLYRRDSTNPAKNVKYFVNVETTGTLAPGAH